MVFNGDDVKDFPFGNPTPELTIRFDNDSDFKAFRTELLERMREDFNLKTIPYNDFVLDCVGEEEP